MEFKTDKKQQKIVKFENEIKRIIGKKTQFEITLKAIDALFDYANGVMQAANISNNDLSNKAKDGAAYIQEIGQLVQDIKQAKKKLDDDLDAIDITEYPPEEPLPEPNTTEQPTVDGVS